MSHSQRESPPYLHMLQAADLPGEAVGATPFSRRLGGGSGISKVQGPPKAFREAEGQQTTTSFTVLVPRPMRVVGKGRWASFAQGLGRFEPSAPNRTQLLSELDRVRHGTAEGRPISDLVYDHAARFIEILPPDAPDPELSIDEDAEVELDWYFGPHAVLWVGLGRDGLIRYASLFGQSKSNGAEPFQGRIPDQVKVTLTRFAALSLGV